MTCPGLGEGVAEPAQTTAGLFVCISFHHTERGAGSWEGRRPGLTQGPVAPCRSWCSEGNLEMLCHPGHTRGAQGRSQAASATAESR